MQKSKIERRLSRCGYIQRQEMEIHAILVGVRQVTPIAFTDDHCFSNLTELQTILLKYQAETKISNRGRVIVLFRNKPTDFELNTRRHFIVLFLIVALIAAF